MNYPTLNPQVATSQSVGGDFVVAKESRVATYQCLIASPNHSRRQLLEEAATEAGWDTVVCAYAPHAFSVTSELRFQLALIDIEMIESKASQQRGSSDFRQVCERIVSDGNDCLLAVYGGIGDSQEEIWARQMGVWLYLPGIADVEGIRTLCNDARGITDQLAKARKKAILS